MKVSELEGAQLDHWVARAHGWIDKGLGYWGTEAPGTTAHRDEWHPSTDWRQGGLIIDRERIGVMPRAGLAWAAWMADDMDPSGIADKPLVAAMRAYVTSKFGEEVPE